MNTRLAVSILLVLVCSVALSVVPTSPSHARASAAGSPRSTTATTVTAFNSIAPMDASAIELVGHIGGGIRAAIISDTLGYMIEGNGLTIADLSVPTQTVRLSQLPLPINGYSTLYIAGNFTYITLGVDGLQIVDVGDPAHPVLRGRFTNPPTADPALGATQDVSTVGTIIYLASGSNGLQVVDGGDPDHPTLLKSIPTGNSVQGVGVSGNRMYVYSFNKNIPGDSTCGIYDVSNPSSPVYVDGTVGSCPPSSPDHLEYTTSGTNLLIYDYTDIHHPALLSTYTMPWPAYVYHVVGDRVYLFDNSDTLRIVQLQHNPDTLVVLGSFPVLAKLRSMQVIGNRAYLAVANKPYGFIDVGLLIVDISDPANPALLGTFTTFGRAQDVQVVGNLAYIAGGVAPLLFPESFNYGNGLQIVDISDPASPLVKGRFLTPTSTHNVQVTQEIAYLAAGESELKIVDVTNPVSPTLLGESHVLSDVLDVQVDGALAYVLGCASPGCHEVAGFIKLAIIDVNDPAHPTLRGSTQFSASAPYQVRTIQVVNNVAYIAAGVDGLKIVDVADPAHPVLLGSYSSWITDLQIVGSLAYLVQAVHTNPCCDIALIVTDVSNPAAPVERSKLVFYQNNPSEERLRVVGNFAYVTGNGLAIIDVTDSDHPTPRYYQPTFSGGRLDILNNLVYTAGESGLTIMRVFPERFLATALLPERVFLPAVRK